VKAVADSLMVDKQSDSSGLGEYCWLNESCPPATEDAAAADKPEPPGMMMFYILRCCIWNGLIDTVCTIFLSCCVCLLMFQSHFLLAFCDYTATSVSHVMCQCHFGRYK